MTRPLRLIGGLVALVVALPLLVACSGDDGTDLPALPPPPPSTTTTEPIDYSQVALPAITPGQTPPITRPREPGQASIAGRVIDDTGAPVPGALVRATYYLNPSAPEIIEMLSGEDGGYRFEQLYGGSWRIRAWQEPYLATLEAPSFFMGATEQKILDLKVRTVPEVAVTANMAPNPPLVGWPAELAVRVVTQIVDSAGAVKRSAASEAEVSLSVTGRWSLQSGSNPSTTDSDGTVRWTLSCGDEGSQSVSAVVYGREFPLTLPSCLSPASTTTTTTTVPPSTTSTTKRKTTTTTARPKSTSSTKPPIQPR